MSDSIKETAAEVAALIPRFSWELMDEEQRDALMENVVLPRYMKTTADDVQMGPKFWAGLVGATPEAVKQRIYRLEASQKAGEGEGTGAAWKARRERAVKQMARENPALIAEAIVNAPKEAQAELADNIVKSESAEPSLKRVAGGPKRHPRPEKPTEQILSGAVFALWNAYQRLLDETPDEQTKYMMGQSAGRAERLARAIGDLLATGSFDDELADLMASVEAEEQSV